MAASAGAAADEELGVFEFLLGLAVIAGGLYCCCACCCRVCGICSRGKAQGNEAEGKPVGKVQVAGLQMPVEHLRRRKELMTAYVIWLFAGLLGGHHFYLDRVLHGFLAVWSGNFFLLGWLLDGLMLPFYVRTANCCTASPAPSDGTFRRVLCRLPATLLLWLFSLSAFFMYGPRTLHDLGVVDIERRIAGTERNPYDILGVPRNTSNSGAIAVHHEQMRRLLAEPACGERCEARKRELDLVLGYFDGSAWRPEDEQEEEGGAGAGARTGRRRGESQGRHDAEESSWKDWSDFVSAEWRGLADAFRGRDLGAEPRQKPARAQRRGGREAAGGRADADSAVPPPSPAKRSRKGRRRASSQGKRSDL